MALSDKQKRILKRLEQIKARASQAAVSEKQVPPDLAEEAAGLALELLEEKK